MKCPNCNAEATSAFCPYCGSEMPREKTTTNINDNSSHVTNNYYYVQAPVQEAKNIHKNQIKNETLSTKSKGVCFILCFFFGFFGVHHFYVGKIGTGILYLFTCGLFGFGWLIDIFKILANSFTDKNGFRLS